MNERTIDRTNEFRWQHYYYYYYLLVFLNNATECNIIYIVVHCTFHHFLPRVRLRLEFRVRLYSVMYWMGFVNVAATMNVRPMLENVVNRYWSHCLPYRRPDLMAFQRSDWANAVDLNPFVALIEISPCERSMAFFSTWFSNSPIALSFILWFVSWNQRIRTHNAHTHAPKSNCQCSIKTEGFHNHHTKKRIYILCSRLNSTRLFFASTQF